MLGRSHFILAGASYIALSARPLETSWGTFSAPVLSGGPLTDEAAVALSVAIAAVCGLAPDLDKQGSTASRSAGPVTRVLSWGIERSFGHRGGFHSLLGILLGYVGGQLLGRLLNLDGMGGLVAYGWSVHLLTDAWTVRGVPLFWPVTSMHVKLPPWLSTGSTLEAVMMVLVLGGLAFYASGYAIQLVPSSDSP